MNHQYLQELATSIEGEFYADNTIRTLYATDASAYREMPLAVALPKTIEDIKTLINKSDIKETDIRSILFEKRKHNLKAFLFLLKNLVVQGKPSIDFYREKYSIPPGDEAIWHHFLKSNVWILGLNVDIKFIREFYDEQKVRSKAQILFQPRMCK